MLVQENNRSNLEKVITQSELLSHSCLSEPWEKTDPFFRDQLMQWQQTLQDAAGRINTADQSAFAESLQCLNSCIQKFIQVLTEKDCILLSNTLVNDWIPTLQKLENNLS